MNMSGKAAKLFELPNEFNRALQEYLQVISGVEKLYDRVSQYILE